MPHQCTTRLLEHKILTKDHQGMGLPLLPVAGLPSNIPGLPLNIAFPLARDAPSNRFAFVRQVHLNFGYVTSSSPRKSNLYLTFNSNMYPIQTASPDSHKNNNFHAVHSMHFIQDKSDAAQLQRKFERGSNVEA